MARRDGAPPEPADGRILRLSSATEHGRALLRDAAERAKLAPLLGRSRHGLDLTAFASFVDAQPLRRAGRRGTRTLGPMQVDTDLLARVDAFAARHKTSRRQVIELLVEELVGQPERDY